MKGTVQCQVLTEWAAEIHTVWGGDNTDRSANILKLIHVSHRALHMKKKLLPFRCKTTELYLKH